MIKRKKGVLLAENIIFLILNLIFLSVLMLFIFRQGAGAIVLEQSYAKQIALLIDSAKPGTIIKLNMDDALIEAEKNVLTKDLVEINDNIVTVRLTDKGGYEYSFFNDVDVQIHHERSIGEDVSFNGYVFVINEKVAEKEVEEEEEIEDEE